MLALKNFLSCIAAFAAIAVCASGCAGQGVDQGVPGDSGNYTKDNRELASLLVNRDYGKAGEFLDGFFDKSFSLLYKPPQEGWRFSLQQSVQGSEVVTASRLLDSNPGGDTRVLLVFYVESTNGKGPNVTAMSFDYSGKDSRVAFYNGSAPQLYRALGEEVTRVQQPNANLDPSVLGWVWVTGHNGSYPGQYGNINVPKIIEDLKARATAVGLDPKILEGFSVTVEPGDHSSNLAVDSLGVVLTHHSGAEILVGSEIHQTGGEVISSIVLGNNLDLNRMLVRLYCVLNGPYHISASNRSVTPTAALAQQRRNSGSSAVPVPGQ